MKVSGRYGYSVLCLSLNMLNDNMEKYLILDMLEAGHYAPELHYNILNKFYFKCVIIVMLFAQQEEELINVRRGLQTLFLSEDREF